MEIKHLSQDEIAAHKSRYPESRAKEWALLDDGEWSDFFDTEAEAKAALEEWILTNLVDEAFRHWAKKTAEEAGVELAKVLEKVREVLEIRYPPEEPPAGDESVLPLAGWPCCACEEVIKGDDDHSAVVMLNKLATWKYPAFSTFPAGTHGRASASLCGRCADEQRPPQYAVKRLIDEPPDCLGRDVLLDESYIRVPLSELKDIPGV